MKITYLKLSSVSDREMIECNFGLGKDFNTLRNQERKEFNQKLYTRFIRVMKKSKYYNI